MGRDIDDEEPVRNIEQAQQPTEQPGRLNLLDLTQAGADQSLGRIGDRAPEVPPSVQQFVDGLGDSVAKYMQSIQDANPDDLLHWRTGLQDTFDYMSKTDSIYCGGGAGLTPGQFQQLSNSLNKSEPESKPV